VEVNGERWNDAYFRKIEHPLMDVASMSDPKSHEGKLNFRLTVPVILHALRVPAHSYWVLPTLAACGAASLIVISCVFAFRVTGDRVCGLYAALAVSCSYIGSFGFTMYYDTIAIAQLAVAMLPSLHWSGRALLVFTAAFTDERAFFAAPFLLVQTLCSPPLAKNVRARLAQPESLAVLAGMGAYYAGRLALEQFAHLSSPHGDIGPGMLFKTSTYWHAGLWLSLKGGWLLLGVAATCLWQQQRYFALVSLVGAMLLTLGIGFQVFDVMRSVAYVFPAFLIAIMVVAGYEPLYWTRVYCFGAFLISLLAGNYNIWTYGITWFRPLAAVFVEHLLHLIAASLKWS
jgi:hypothetical protein